ncbi:11430_t:CDS:1 [Funneliformis geosporum]|uniref:1186_t:CDS:1 n=1 Tax=Funneliformis geosporum TaxID=1117311 RepID=A0A9W4WR07_9GLOM|nr:11430_t:CDS:1 [Funneliformis geosporum]CAI2172482.1 1186_t:CDS:1 [Funneliformis geosporum]
MQVKRSIERVEPQLFQELVTPIKRQKAYYEWEVLLGVIPFTLSEPFTTETSIIADYNVREMNLNECQKQSVVPNELEVESDKILKFSEVDNDEYEADVSSSSSDEHSDSSDEESDLDASEESEFENVVKKKRCGAMWSPECRRAGRCICAEKFDDYD